jgi:hypothetical protein
LPKNDDHCIVVEGFGKSSHLGPFATCMNLCQISAGKVPPATEIPCTLLISRSAFG